MEKEFLTANAATQLKHVFKSLKENLKGKVSLTQFREFVLSIQPYYNTPAMWKHIENVFYGRVADYPLTEYLKQYSVLIEAKA